MRTLIILKKIKKQNNQKEKPQEQVHMKDIRDIMHIRDLLVKAEHYLNTHRYDEAIEVLNKIPESLDKEFLSGVWTNLGDAYLHKGQYANAIIVLTKALRYIPLEIRGQPLSLLGQSYLWNRQYIDAVKIFEEIINLPPNISRFPKVEDLFVDYNLLGEAYLQLFDYKKAIEAFEHALSIKPDFEEAHHNLKFAQFKQGRSKNSKSIPITINTKEEIQWWISFGTRIQADGLHTGIIWKFDSGRISLHKALELDPENEDVKRGLEIFNHNRRLYAK